MSKTGPGITVVTHNGKLPRDGGKRIAYVVGQMAFPLGGSPYRIPSPEEQKPAVRNIDSPSFTLRRSRYDDEECPSCHHYPNSGTESVQASDGTLVKVIFCSKCDKPFKPYR